MKILSVIACLIGVSRAELIPEDHRMIGYLENWRECPNNAQLEQYTHIAVGFAVTYTYDAAKNRCSETCYIDVPPMCTSMRSAEAIATWKAKGIKTILSFGGAGMGGSWEGDVNNCWDFCFGREQQVIDRLVELVNDLGVDGVDIDYEYYYEDNQHGRGFTKGPEAINFLETVSVGFKERMPDKIFSHAPMDIDLVPGTEYFSMLQRISDSIDFLMPQYYNGVTRPNMDGFAQRNIGQVSPSDHFNDLLVSVFDNDATRIVFGFCIGKCGASGSNSNADQAVVVLNELENEHRCHGGAFFWAVSDDVNGEFSLALNDAMNFNRGCNTPLDTPTAPVATPVFSPVARPVFLPVATPFVSPVAPVAAPAGGPVYVPFAAAPIAVPTEPVAPPMESPIFSATEPSPPVFTGPDFFAPSNTNSASWSLCPLRVAFAISVAVLGFVV